MQKETGKKRILVVDDEEIVRYSLVNILRTNGYCVDSVSNAESALESLYQKRYHLVLTDLVMEDMDGLDLLEKVKVISPRTMVIVITGYGSIKTAVNALRMGVYDYLLKPCDEQELLLRVKRALNMQRFGAEQRRVQETTAISRTTVTLSDKINTPLNIILGNIEILQLCPEVTKVGKIKDTLGVMEDQIFKIKEVMERLANFSRTDTDKSWSIKDKELSDITREGGLTNEQ